jgi:hypothetical protein
MKVANFFSFLASSYFHCTLLSFLPLFLPSLTSYLIISSIRSFCHFVYSIPLQGDQPCVFNEVFDMKTLVPTEFCQR